MAISADKRWLNTSTSGSSRKASISPRVTGIVLELSSANISLFGVSIFNTCSSFSTVCTFSSSIAGASPTPAFELVLGPQSSVQVEIDCSPITLVKKSDSFCGVSKA